jgi:adenylate kinase
MNVILLGLPGAGKGTQARWICENQAIPHISTGDLFRKALQDETELGLLAKTYMSKGELVPDEVTIGLAMDRLDGSDCAKGFLLDGFPRNLVQAEALGEYLSRQSKQVDHVIYVEVDEHILLERLTGRRVCPGCSSTFHIVHNPPQAHGKCDSCQEALVHREDDQEATVAERLRINKDLTERLVHHYRSKGVLRTIDGSKDIAVVTSEMIHVFSA